MNNVDGCNTQKDEVIPIHLTDVTLREWDQAPLTSFAQEQKEVVALMLAELWVDTIEVWFGANKVDSQNITAVSNILKGYDVEISSLWRSTTWDTQASLDALSAVDKPRIHIFVAMSQEHLKWKFWSRDEPLEEIRKRILDSALANIARVKKWEEENWKNVSIEFSPEDATGNAIKEKNWKKYFDLEDNEDFDFLVKVCEQAIIAWAKVINVPDTLWNLLPHQTYEFFNTLNSRLSHLKENYDFWLSSHIHNDLGTATANTIEAMRWWAKYLETTVLWIGERAWNGPTEEVVWIISNGWHNVTPWIEYTLNSNIKTELVGPVVDFVRKILWVDKTLQSPFVWVLSDSDWSGVHNANLDLYWGSKNKAKFWGEDIPEFFSARWWVNQLISMLSHYWIILERNKIIDQVPIFSQKAEENRALYWSNVYSTYLKNQWKYSIDHFHIEDNAVGLSINVNGKEISFNWEVEWENWVINTFIDLINEKLWEDTVKIMDLNIRTKANLYDEIQKFRKRVWDVVSDKFNNKMNILENWLKWTEHSSEVEAIAEVDLEVRGQRVCSISSDHNTNKWVIKAILEWVLYELSLQNSKNQ